MPTRFAIWLSGGLLGLLAGCYVPSYYRVAFPESVVQEIPDQVVDSSGQLLVVPCWRWYKTSRYGFGPPAIVEASEVAQLTERLSIWTGFEMVDLLGHEGLEAPVACGVLIASSNGRAFRADYRYRSPRSENEKGYWHWGNQTSAQIGPQLKADLLETLAQHKPEENRLWRLFGHRRGEILGAPGELSRAKEFVERLEAGGDDQWVSSSDSN